MYYEYRVTTPPNTLTDNPQRVYLRLTRGVMDTIWIEFPAGCCGLVGVRLLHGEYQIVPVSPSDWLCSDNAIIEMRGEWPITEEPYAIVCETYNEDEWFEHGPVVRVSVSIPEEPKPIPVVLVSQEPVSLPAGEWPGVQE